MRKNQSTQGDVTRISGIDVATDRFISVNGPPLTTLPSWGMLLNTAEVEYHLHPAITYELHYQVPAYVLIHAFNGAEGRFGMNEHGLDHWRLEARTTCIVPPDTQAKVVQTSPLEFLGLRIATQRVDRIATGLDPDWTGLNDLFKTVDPALTTLCSEMRRAMIAEPLGSGAYLDSLTDAVVTRLVSAHLASTSETPTGPEILSPAMARRLAQTIEGRLEGSIRVADLAAEVGLSRAHFTRAFTRNFGSAPRDYILSRRIARARAMLTETDFSVSQIAMRCGFANPSHLTTAFQRELGLTPTSYRKALTQE